jgi:hypothetical protein
VGDRGSDRLRDRAHARAVVAGGGRSLSVFRVAPARRARV